MYSKEPSEAGSTQPVPGRGHHEQLGAVEAARPLEVVDGERGPVLDVLGAGDARVDADRVLGRLPGEGLDVLGGRTAAHEDPTLAAQVVPRHDRAGAARAQGSGRHRDLPRRALVAQRVDAVGGADGGVEQDPVDQRAPSTPTRSTSPVARAARSPIRVASRPDSRRYAERTARASPTRSTKVTPATSGTRRVATGFSGSTATSSLTCRCQTTGRRRSRVSASTTAATRNARQVARDGVRGPRSAYSRHTQAPSVPSP